MQGVYIIKGANPLSFRVLGNDYATDGRLVFFRGELVKGAQGESVELLKGPEFFYCVKDAKNVFLYKKKLKNADPKSFTYWKREYRDPYVGDSSPVYLLRDKKHIWRFDPPYFPQLIDEKEINYPLPELETILPSIKLEDATMIESVETLLDIWNEQSPNKKLPNIIILDSFSPNRPQMTLESENISVREFISHLCFAAESWKHSMLEGNIILIAPASVIIKPWKTKIYQLSEYEKEFLGIKRRDFAKRTCNNTEQL